MSDQLTTSSLLRYRVCAWCGRFALEGEWVPAADAMRRLNLEPSTLPTVTHGICPDCLAANPPPKRGSRSR